MCRPPKRAARSRSEPAARGLRVLFDRAGRRGRRARRTRARVVAAGRLRDRRACGRGCVGCEFRRTGAVRRRDGVRRIDRAERRRAPRRAARRVRRVGGQRPARAASRDHERPAPWNVRRGRFRRGGRVVARGAVVDPARGSAVRPGVFGRNRARGGGPQCVRASLRSNGCVGARLRVASARGRARPGSGAGLALAAHAPLWIAAGATAAVAALALGRAMARRLGGVLVGDAYGAIVVILDVALLSAIALLQGH